MRFDIRALDATQQLRCEVIDAADTAAAQALLAARGWVALQVQPQREARSWRLRRVARFSLTMLAQELHALLEAGLGLSEALEALAEREQPGPTRSLLDRLQADLRDGLRLSDAAARQPEHFPPLFVGMLRAAEHTSDLPQALQRYIDWHGRVDQLRSRLVSAAIYPAILCAVGLLVSLFLMLQVVPSFAEVYRDGGRAMPWASGLLMRSGQWLREHVLVLSVAVLLLGVAAVRQVRAVSQRGGWVAMLRRVPGISLQVQRMELTRLYLTLGMLLEGGIAVLPALALMARTVSRETSLRLASVERALGEGHALSVAFDRAGLSTPVAQRLLRVGERSGQLGVMLSRAARFHDGENLRFVERFTKVFEPALMALIGLLIAAIVMLLYMPIFDLTGSLQ